MLRAGPADVSALEKLLKETATLGTDRYPPHMKRFEMKFDVKELDLTLPNELPMYFIPPHGRDLQARKRDSVHAVHAAAKGA